MVNFYMYRIKAGKMKLEDVPTKWRTQVADELEKER